MSESVSKNRGRASPHRQAQRRKALSLRRTRLFPLVTSENVSYFHNSRGDLFKSVVTSEKRKGSWSLKMVQFANGKPSDVGNAFFEVAPDHSSVVLTWLEKTSAFYRSMGLSSTIKDKGIDFFRVAVEACIKVARAEKISRISLVANRSLGKYYSTYGFRTVREYSPDRLEMVLDFSPRGTWQAPSHTF